MWNRISTTSHRNVTIQKIEKKYFCNNFRTSWKQFFNYFEFCELLIACTKLKYDEKTAALPSLIYFLLTNFLSVTRATKNSKKKFNLILLNWLKEYKLPQQNTQKSLFNLFTVAARSRIN